MKKAICLFLALVVCLSLCACGEKLSSEEERKDVLKERVKDDVIIHFNRYYLGYHPIIGLDPVECDENTFSVTGIVITYDEKGRSYRARIAAVYEYNVEKEKSNGEIGTSCFERISLDIGTFKRTN